MVIFWLLVVYDLVRLWQEIMKGLWSYKVVRFEEYTYFILGCERNDDETRALNTVSATIFCPVALGWIPSERLSFGIPATHESIKGIKSEFVSVATIG